MLTLDQYLTLKIGDVKVLNVGNVKTVKLQNYDLDKYLNFIRYDNRIPKGMDWIKKYLILKPVKKHGNDLGKSVMIIPFFKIPIEVKVKFNNKTDKIDLEDEVFRVYPVDPYLLVGNKKGFINLNKYSKYSLYDLDLEIVSDIEEKGIKISEEGRPIKPSKADTDKAYYPTLFYAGTPFTSKTHRIVALTWVAKPEDDLVINYVVDHKNNNKLDYSINNLKWVSHKENKIKDNHNTIYLDKEFIVKRLKDSVGFTFDTMEEICKFLNLNKDECKEFEEKELPTVVSSGKDEFIIYKKEDLVNITDDFLSNKTKYRYKLIFPNKGTMLLFKTLEEILERFNLKEYKVTNYYKIRLSKALTDYFKEKGGILSYIGEKEVFNQHSLDKYKIQAKNLKTNEIIETPNTKEMGERLKVSKSAIINRLNGNQLAGVPIIAKDGSEWLIRKSTEEFPELKQPKVGKRIPIIILEQGKEYVYTSLREAAKATGYTRDWLSKISKVVNNRRIIKL